MERRNTDIEQFVATYGDNDNDDVFVMSDLYSGGEEEDDYVEEADEDVYRRPLPVAAATVTTPKRSRLDVINSREDNEFMRLLAGALDVDLETLYEHEDLDSAIENEHTLAVSAKRRRLMDEDRQRRIANIKQSIEELKRRLVSAGDQARVDAAYNELDRLRVLVGDEHTLSYTSLVHKCADYDLVLKGTEDDASGLISLMERYYRDEGDNPNTFMRELTDANIDTDDTERIRGIVINALWQRDVRQGGGADTDASYVDTLDQIGDVDTETKNEAVRIKKEITESIKGARVKNEFDVAAYMGIRFAVPSAATRISAKHNDYATYMSALLRARDDVMMRNELTKSVNITAIHTPDLNRRITALDDPSITHIIDTSRDYFKEMYYTKSGVVAQYTNLVQHDRSKLTAYKEDLGAYRALMEKSRVLYEKLLVPIVESVVAIFGDTGTTMTPSTLLNTQVLERYRRDGRIKSGNVTRLDITTHVIADDTFMLYYTTEGTASPQVDAPLDNYLALCDLFVAHADYIRSHNYELRQQIAREEQQLQAILSSREGGEDGMEAEEDEGQRRRRHNTMRTIHVKPNVLDKIDEAYHRVTEYCPKLRGLPLVAMKSRRAIEAGLAGDFARYVAALMADNGILFQSSYKSRLTHEHVIKRKAEMMNRLKAYSYTSRLDSGTPLNRYTFHKDTTDYNSRRGGGGGGGRLLFSASSGFLL